MIYSPSKLETYEACPRKYKFAYIDGIKIEEEGIETFLGNRFHEAMEKLYSERRYRLMSLEEVKAFYQETWQKNFHEKVIIVTPGRTADDYFLLGLKFIEDYYRRYYPFDQNRILGLEQKVEVDLDGTGRYLLQGYIDRIDLTADGVVEIHDYKTSSTLPSQKEIDSDRQLTLYQLGLQQRWPWAERVRLVWHYVAFDLELTATRSSDQLEALRREVIELINLIEVDQEFLPRESGLCQWCGFFSLCPLKKHEAGLKELPPNEYLKEEGVFLVNKYIEYLQQKREAETELEKLKQAIISYANARGLSRVMGSEFHLNLKKQEKIAFPRVEDQERQILENIIKQAGLWEKYSTLDRYAFEKDIKSGQIDPTLFESLAPLIKREISITLYPAKNKPEED